KARTEFRRSTKACRNWAGVLAATFGSMLAGARTMSPTSANTRRNWSLRVEDHRHAAIEKRSLEDTPCRLTSLSGLAGFPWSLVSRPFLPPQCCGREEERKGSY